MKIKYMFVLAVLAVSMLVLPASAVSNDGSIPDFIIKLTDVFSKLPHFDNTTFDRITPVIQVIKDNPINNTTFDRITNVVQAVPKINNTTVDTIVKVVHVIEENPINNTTLDNVTKVVQAIQKINTTTIDQITKVVRAINNIQNNLSNRSD